jgi:hypothetical protein
MPYRERRGRRVVSVLAAALAIGVVVALFR